MTTSALRIERGAPDVSPPFVLLSLLAGYVAVGFAGVALAGEAMPAPPFRPGSGLAFAALVALGLRAWPLILAGALAVAASVGGLNLGAGLNAAGVTLSAVVVAHLVGAHARGLDAFGSLRTTLRAIAFIIVGSLLPALTVPARFLDVWLGHATGMLVVAPCVMLLITTPAAPFTRERWRSLAEAGALFVTLFVVGLIVFAGFIPSDTKTYSLEFLCLPVLLWAAFRFGPREVAVAVAVLSGLAVWGTVRGFGPFASAAPDDALRLLQGYLTVLSITGIAFATTMDERRRAEAQLKELASTDPLTGLVNYRRLLEVLKQEIARSRRTGRTFAVLLVDMDGLKRINDRQGHLAGSRAICRVAAALRACTRETDTVARFGGDEFAVILAESGDDGGPAVLGRVAGELAKHTQSPELTVSGGHAVFPRDGDSATLLLRAADERLYQAKGDRRGAA